MSSTGPNLPGFVSNKPKPRPIPQTFSASGGIVFEKKRGDEPEVDYSKAVAERGLAARSLTTKEKSDLAATKRITGTISAPLPVEVVFEKQVCGGIGRRDIAKSHQFVASSNFLRSCG